jgi:hypothetical protein
MKISAIVSGQAQRVNQGKKPNAQNTTFTGFYPLRGTGTEATLLSAKKVTVEDVVRYFQGHGISCELTNLKNDTKIKNIVINATGSNPEAAAKAKAIKVTQAQDVLNFLNLNKYFGYVAD